LRTTGSAPHSRGGAAWGWKRSGRPSPALNGGAWTLTAEFTEVESGKRADRPELAKALAACRLHRAALLVAKVDRLARSTSFLLRVVEGSGEAGVVFCDLLAIPPGAVGKFILTQMAAVAELEGGLISKRTKDALAAAKARGTVLGGARITKDGQGPGERGKAHVAAARAGRSAKAAARASDLKPALLELFAAGIHEQRAIARALNARGIQAARGGAWSHGQVAAQLRRLAA